jgi:hypothetical protein
MEKKEPTEIDRLTDEMMGYVCDNLCRHPRQARDQEKLEDICAECNLGKFVVKS